MIKCERCGGTDLSISDGRNTTITTEYLRRRRVCSECGYKFSTVEVSMNDYKKMKNANKKAKEFFNAFME